LVVLRARGEKPTVIPQLFVHKDLIAPLSANQSVGHLRVLENNQVIADELVYPEHSIERGNIFIASWDGFKLWFH